jgi:16S rRNA (adenine1518-N6/adenine1519-N6)-dimethyltransferase
VSQLSPSQLLGPTEIRNLAARLGIHPAKRLGQNFVVDAGTVTRITALAGVGPEDVVLEVGPGFGSLTLPLLDAAGRVLAVEVDRALAAQLPLTVADRAPALAGRLEVVTADAARVTALPGPPPTALVANLPYNVAVPVVLHLLATVPSIGRGKAGSVSRGVFWPVPRVDSGLVGLTRRERPEGDLGGGIRGVVPPGQHSVRREAVFAVIDAAFSQRRKTLRSALANWAGSAAEAEAVLRSAGVDPAARGEALGIEEFVRIAAAGAAGA